MCQFAAASAEAPPLHPINLNSTSSAELYPVPGISAATAEKILQLRKSYGAFKSVEDLLAVRGIGRKRLEKMRKYLSVGKPAAAKPATPSANSTPPTEKPPDKP